jgi:hypothetical protein
MFADDFNVSVQWGSLSIAVANMSEAKVSCNSVSKNRDSINNIESLVPYFLKNYVNDFAVFNQWRFLMQPYWISVYLASTWYTFFFM